MRILQALVGQVRAPGFTDCTDLSEALGDSQITVAVLKSKGQRDKTLGLCGIGDPKGSLEYATP